MMSNELTLAKCIREKDLLKVIPFSKSTLWRKVADGTFPKPIKISTKVTVWKWFDVDQWFRQIELSETKQDRVDS